MKYLIIGNKGQLGSNFEKEFKQKNCDFNGVDIQEVDVTNQKAINSCITAVKPKIVINCSAYNQVEISEKEPKMAYKVNRDGVRNIAKICRENNCFLVHYGTNHVFDGEKSGSYKEEDPTNPINEYGKSKLQGENLVKEILPDKSLILRTSWLYGEGPQNFIYKLLKRTKEGLEPVGAVNEKSTPTSTKLLVDLTIRALENNLIGLYHTVNSGSATRWEWAKQIFDITGIQKDIKKVEVSFFNLVAKLPENSTLDNTKLSRALGIEIPNWKKELRSFITEQNYFEFKL